jgi:hypothetical protein
MGTFRVCTGLVNESAILQKHIRKFRLYVHVITYVNEVTKWQELLQQNWSKY